MLAIALALGVALALFFRFANDWRVLTLAAADDADIAVAKAVEQLHRGVDVSEVRVLPFRSLTEASDAVDAGQANLAIVRSDVAVPKRAGTMLIVHKDAGLLIAAPQSKITKLSDLAKKRVGIVAGDAANVRLFDTIVNFYALPAGSITHVPLQAEQIESLAKTKLVDAVFVVAPLTSPVVTQIFSALSTDKIRAVLVEFKDA